MSEEWFIVTRHGVAGPFSTEALRVRLADSPMARDTKATMVGGDTRPLYEWPQFSDMNGAAPGSADQSWRLGPSGGGCIVALGAVASVATWLLAGPLFTVPVAVVALFVAWLVRS